MPIPGMNLASEWLARLFLLLQRNQYEFTSLEGRSPALSYRRCARMRGFQQGQSPRKLMTLFSGLNGYTENFLHNTPVRGLYSIFSAKMDLYGHK